MDFPISEVFIAPQGEGFKVGKLMIFVRLAGCTVGKRYPDSEYNKDGNHSGLFPIYTNKCTLADGREFPCDTDYTMKHKINYAALRDMLKKESKVCKEICLTGGEPLMHVNSGVVTELVYRLISDKYKINLETSGTIPITEGVRFVLNSIDHICVSPKIGFKEEYLDEGNEFKILVDDNFDWDKFPFLTKIDMKRVFLQPVNFEHEVNIKNLETCLEIQKKYPEVRISLQAHKFWGTR